jgi:iron complex transport system substrate-binding protein
LAHKTARCHFPRIIVFLCIFFLPFFPRQHQQNTRHQNIIDDLGRTVTIPQSLTRIVSLAPNITEILYAVGADSLIVGVTDYCDYPSQAKQKPHIGGMINPSIEAIVGTQPDLVLISVEGNSRLDFERLKKLSIPVFATNPRTIEGVLKSVLDIGKLTGVPQNAERLISELRSRHDSITHLYRQQHHPRVLVIFSLTPLMVAGNGSFVDELITDAGGINLGSSGKGPYPLFSREEILRLQPDKIVLTSDIAVSSVDLLHHYPEWKTLNAFRFGAVSTIDASLISRPGPRVIDGLAELARILHDSN